MIFYKHYIGDFQRDTAHLSLTERGAYRALLDHHYATEKALPLDAVALCRLVGAVSKAEREAVQRVLREFWNETPDGWINSRAQKEMGKAEHQRAVNQATAAAREAARKRAREANETSTNRATNDQPNHSHSHSQTTTDSVGTSAPTESRATPAGLLSRALRERGVESNPMEPRLLAFAAAGITPQLAAAAADEARRTKGNGTRIPPGYVYAVLDRWLAEPASRPTAAYDPEAVAAEALRIMAERDRHATQ